MNLTAKLKPSPFFTMSTIAMCILCILEEFHNLTSSRRVAQEGTLRCFDHVMKCCNCFSHVHGDKDLLCDGCADSGIGATIGEILSEQSGEGNAWIDCMYMTTKTTTEEKVACGCNYCMEHLYDY